MPTQISTDGEFLTVKQVATLLNISPRSVRRMLAANELGAYKLQGVIRISKSDIDRYLEKCRRAPVGE